MDLQGQVDQLWRKLAEMERAWRGRTEALERGAKMEAQNTLGLVQMDGVLAKRIEALEARVGVETIDEYLARVSAKVLEREDSESLRCGTPSCRTCRWYSGGGKNPAPYGSCHRHPPTPLPFDALRAETPSSLWPTVEKHHFCGEHSLRE